jgi:hypothetical protein
MFLNFDPGFLKILFFIVMNNIGLDADTLDGLHLVFNLGQGDGIGNKHQVNTFTNANTLAIKNQLVFPFLKGPGTSINFAHFPVRT